MRGKNARESERKLPTGCVKGPLMCSQMKKYTKCSISFKTASLGLKEKVQERNNLPNNASRQKFGVTNVTRDVREASEQITPRDRESHSRILFSP